MCKTSSTEQSRATLHGAGAKTGAWTMEGKTTWCNKDSIPPEMRHVQKKVKPGIRASGAQRFAAVLALPYNEDYMGRRRSCSTSALPHTRLRQVARLGVTHGFFCRPSALFCAFRGERVDGPQSASLLTRHFHTWKAVCVFPPEDTARHVAFFLRTSGQRFSSLAACSQRPFSICR